MSCVMDCDTQDKSGSPCYECLQDSIQRVRELANRLENKEAFHQLTAYACAEEIRKALDGATDEA